MNRAAVFWFTGLSGAGKTTIAEGVREKLEAEGHAVLILDGDEVRRRFHATLGFGESDIKRNNALIVDLCASARADHDVILVPIIAPYRQARDSARAALAPGFHEIFVDSPLECVLKRDVKGLYRRAARGEIPRLVGTTGASPFEPPESPDLVIASVDEPPAQSIDRLHRYVFRHLAATTTGGS